MKRKLKYLITAVLVVIFASSLTVCAYAEENDAEATVEVGDNLFSVAYEEISSYASEILCGLTLAASLILAFAYKKVLLPLVKGALLSIGNTVTKIGESAKRSEEKSALLEESVGANIESAKDMISSMAEKLSELDASVKEKLECDEKAKREYEKLSLIIDGQIDMLYDIFMSSALPQYQKDAVGERIAKMKGMVKRDEVTD